MAKCSVLKANALFLATLFLVSNGGGISKVLKNNDGSEEEWGYVEVRPKAHMFWWLYRSPYRVDDPNKPWPVILWLQGGPGASGTGIGNFQEVGPMDTNLKPRNSTWLKKADLLFVDNPVGTGFSYVEENELVVKSDEEAGEDLKSLLMAVFNKNEKLQKSPLYIVAESYGGKFAVTLGLAAHKAILSRQLKLTLGGVVLGDSWISPQDFAVSWGPLLKDMSRLDDGGLEKANRLTDKIQEEIRKGEFVNATDTWSQLETAISQSSNNVIISAMERGPFKAPIHEVQGPDRDLGWRPPLPGWTLLNTDGASKGNPGRAGGGGVFRNCLGNWVFGFAERFGVCSATKAELKAILRGLRIAREQGFTRLLVKSDSKRVVEIIQGVLHSIGEIDILATQCRRLLKLSDWMVVLEHGCRGENKVADKLANMGVLLPLDLCLYTSPPVDVHDLLRNDVIGGTRPDFTS